MALGVCGLAAVTSDLLASALPTRPAQATVPSPPAPSVPAVDPAPPSLPATLQDRVLLARHLR